jgi:hypothetical protein
MILLRIFKDSRLAGMLGLFLLSLGVFLRSFIHPGPLEGYVGMPFYTLIFGAIHTVPVLDRIVALLLIWLLAFLLVRTGIQYVLLEQRSIMPALFLILVSAALPATQQVSPAMVGGIFYLMAFHTLFDSHDKPPDTLIVFNATLVLAFGCMFYLKLIWFVPLIWVSLGTLRGVTLRELIYPLLAIGLMFLFVFTWYWAVRDDAEGFATLMRENLSFRTAWQPKHYSTFIYAGYILLLVILASIYMVNRFQVRKTASQLIYQVMFYMFIAGVIFYILIARYEPTSLVYIGFPTAFILSNYFHRRTSHWALELALWICIGLLVFAQVMVR